MAWSASAYYRQAMADNHKATVVINWDLETHKLALMNNSVTPDKDATAANSALGAGTWASNEISGTGYGAGGVALANTTVTTPSTGVVMWDADDASWTTASFTTYGGLVYADALTTPVADQGLCFVYFGGAFTVTVGTFTVQWAANGIFRVTV